MFKNRFNLRAVLAIAISLAVMIVFNSCNKDDNDNSKKTDTEQTNNGNGSGSGNTSDNTTVDGRLTRAGLTLNAVKPDTRFAEAGLPEHGDSDKTKVELYLTGSEALTAEWKETYFNKLRDALAAASDDNKVYKAYYGLGEPVEISLEEVNWNAWLVIIQASYKVNGKWITITAGTVPAEKEGFTNAISLDFNY
jgi:hypothetical protein